MESTTVTTTVNIKSHLSTATSSEEYIDAFVTLSLKTRSLTVRHPGIPLLGSTHTIPFDQIHFLKCAADLELLPSEYKVWGPGHSWIWWAWDLRRAGLLKRTERERCFVARVSVGWASIWIGFTVENLELFKRTMDECELDQKGITW